LTTEANRTETLKSDDSQEYLGDLPFTKHALLSEYSKHAQSWMEDVAEIALMNRSDFFRDVFAYCATNENYDFAQLLNLFQNDAIDDISLRYDWLHNLGRLVAFQELTPGDTNCALQFLALSTNRVALRTTKIENVKLRIQLHAERGEFSEAEILLTEFGALLGEEAEDFAVDIGNPFVNEEASSVEAWLAGFNAPIEGSGLSPVVLDGQDSTLPFNALKAESAFRTTNNGPLISVIMTSFEPDEASLELAIRSILDQSWRNLELIVVDDASPGGPPKFVEKLAEIDPRVKIFVLPENRGTYYARNVGLWAAQGTYITGQDSDDWSHPDRLTLQVRELQNDPDISGVVGQAIRSDDNLFRIKRGLSFQRMCEVSLMYRAEPAREMGGYLESRKGADSEFRMRLEKYTKKPVRRLDRPIYLTRLSLGSLSRSDFRVGWAHPNRRAFLNYMRHWHGTAKSPGLKLPQDQSAVLGLPPKFQSIQTSGRQFDCVILTDWRHDGDATRSALAEISAMQAQGKHVGIMQLNGAFPGHAPASKLLSDIQESINTGSLELVIPDEEAKIGTLIVNSAELLQFAPANGFENKVESLVILADRAPSAWDGSEPIYHPVECSDRAVELFGVEPVWITQDAGVHRYLTAFSVEIELWQDVVPYVLPDMTQRAGYRNRRPRYDKPVIGRTTDNIKAKWPRSNADAVHLWPPQSDKAIVGIWGTSECYVRRYGKKAWPSHWDVLLPRTSTLDIFLENVDYFIYYPDDNWPQESSYEALLAFSKGATVMLPPRFASCHAGMAVMLNPNDVSTFVQQDWLTGNALGEGNILSDFETENRAEKFVQVLERISEFTGGKHAQMRQPS